MNRPTFFSKGFVFFIFSVFFLWGVCAWILFSLHPSPSRCSEKYRSDKTITVNYYKITAQTAKSTKELEQGLSNRNCIGNYQAMLFIFDKPDYYPMWMKGMKFNIDIVWLSADKQVVDISADVAPSTYPKNFVNTKPAQYILELGAGQAGSLNLKTGTNLSF